MNQVYLLKILKSNYCKAIFVVSFFLGYFLLPEEVFYNVNRILALIYLLTFASLMTCVVRGLKEEINIAHKNKASVLGIISAVVGFAAFHACGIAAPICGMSAGLGIVALVFPNFLYSFLVDNGYLVIYFSLFIQLGAILSLKCLSRNHK